MSAIPERPRLGAHVSARRHVVDGRALIVLHAGDRLLQIGDREWAALEAADGTRDLEGIGIATAQRGTPVRADHLRTFFDQLAELGLLADHDEPDPAPAFARSLPVRPLPGYHFSCDGSGGCCSQYDTIVFTPLDRARAQATLPERSPVFVPERGSTSSLTVVTRAEGSCSFLDPDGRCAIHARAGVEAKPAGCRSFPSRYVDVGDHIRVVPRPECACVFASLDREGEALTRARTGDELPPEQYVPRAAVTREAVAFFDRMAAHEASDWAAFVWSLAAHLGAHGIGGDAPAITLDPPVWPHLDRVRASAERLARVHCAWRAEHDVVRRGVEWVQAALSRIEDDLPPAREPRDEAFYVRATLYAVPGGAGASAADELRERAIAMWIARAFGDDARATTQGQHPIAIVEALARGHGLDLSGARSTSAV